MQSKNKNDGIQLPTRYQRYVLAKRHLGGQGGGKILPIRKGNQVNDKVQQEQRGKRSRASCLNTRYGQRWTNESYIKEGCIKQLNNPKHSNDRIYSKEGISPTLNTAQGGRRQPFIAAERGRYNKDGSTSQRLETRKDNVSNTLTGVEKDNRVLIPEATKKGYAEAQEGDSINLSVPNSKTRRGRVGKGVAQTIDTGMQQYTLTKNTKIRRLTPVECERLQGFSDFFTAKGINEKEEEVDISDSQRYKVLGNAVTTNVVKAIAEKLL